MYNSSQLSQVSFTRGATGKITSGTKKQISKACDYGEWLFGNCTGTEK